MSKTPPFSLYQIFYHLDLMPCCGKPLGYIKEIISDDHTNIKCCWCCTKFKLSLPKRTMTRL